MRKCPFCLQEIPEDAKVCKHCSKTVVKRCTSCNQEIVAGRKLVVERRGEVDPVGGREPREEAA